MSTCETCAHGYDVGIWAGAPVYCAPQAVVHKAIHCCSAYRQITNDEMKERNDAKFGIPIQSHATTNPDL